MCDICSQFNPFQRDWLHVSEDDGSDALRNSRFVLVSEQADGQSGTTTTVTQANVPTFSIARIADVLLHGSWNTHGGNTWKFDLDIDRNPNDVITVNYSGLSQAGQWFAKEALAAWTAATGIRFSTAGSGAQIVLDDTNSGARTSTSAYTTGEIIQARINISRAWIEGDEYTHDAYSLRTFIHEIGHALGLGHPANYGATQNDGDNFGTDATFANDSWQTTVMSYYSQKENTATAATLAYVLTPQIADLVAIRELYGTTGTLRKGNTIYGEGSTAGDYFDVLEDNWKTTAFTIVDDGGVDTIDFSNTGRDQTVDLSPGAFSSVGNRVENMAIAQGTVIEKFRSGDGDDRITGNGANNRIEGGGGKDLILGVKGADKLFGEAGNDELRGGNGNDSLFGGSGQDVLKGEAGRDVLEGGGGKDTLIGGDANDRLIGNDGNDSLRGGDGEDKLVGNTGNDGLSGQGGSDVLLGGNGADTLRGGNQGDLLDGGAGPDILFGDAGNDIFRFNTGGGKDTIRDWQDGRDRIDLSDWGMTSIGEVRAIAEDVTGGIALRFNAKDVLTIKGLALEDLSNNDVIFDLG